MDKRAALVPVLLVAGLIAAVTGATSALRLIGPGAFGPGGKPLTQVDVQRSLAQHPTAPSTATPSAVPTHTPPSSRPTHHSHPAHKTVKSSFSTSGGTVFAACNSGQATLTSWILASGYQDDNVVRGPAATAQVTFKSSASEITVTVTCANGRPTFATQADDNGGGGGDDHGGGRGGGGGRGPG